MTGTIDLSIVIVSYHGSSHAGLSGIPETADGGKEIWVVDNASTDNSVQRILSQFPDAHLIVNETNRGFAAPMQRCPLPGRYIVFQIRHHRENGRSSKGGSGYGRQPAYRTGRC